MVNATGRISKEIGRREEWYEVLEVTVPVGREKRNVMHQ